MEKHIVRIIDIEDLTYNVKRFIVERPENYSFLPGQATDVAINKPGLENESRSFTFTGLNEWENLEFIIKIYKDHNGVTKKLSELKPGDELIIHDVWGSIHYKGPGTFIAGGAGITPFISILRHLKKQNQLEGNSLIFANNSRADIILENELYGILGGKYINILANEKIKGYKYGRITESFLRETLPENNQMLYLCGPPPMIFALEEQLKNLNINDEYIIKEDL